MVTMPVLPSSHAARRPPPAPNPTPDTALSCLLAAGERAVRGGDWLAALQHVHAARQLCAIDPTSTAMMADLDRRCDCLAHRVRPPRLVDSPSGPPAAQAALTWVERVLRLPPSLVLLVLARAAWYTAGADRDRRVALARHLLDGLAAQSADHPADLSAFLLAGSLLDPASGPVVARGVAAYAAGDHLTALHLLVPHVEEVLRGLLARLGEPVTWQRADGRVQVASLERLLHTGALRRALGSGLVACLGRVLLAGGDDSLRHRVAHGRLTPDAATRTVSQDLLLCYLRLSRCTLPPAPVVRAG